MFVRLNVCLYVRSIIAPLRRFPLMRVSTYASLVRFSNSPNAVSLADTARSSDGSLTAASGKIGRHVGGA